jgi:glycosyltransferase involved in cell wall biosynthesis
LKIVHVTYSAKGGAGIAARRLHNSLQKKGVLSAFISINLTINFDNVIVDDDFFKYKKPSLLLKIGRKIYNIFNFTERALLEKKISSQAKNNNFEKLSLPFSNFKLHNHPLVEEADIINLHWVSGILDYPSFFKKCKKPIVWTLHDMNPCLGLFHYENDMKIASKELIRINTEALKIYKKSLDNIKKAVIVTPSQWLSKESLDYNLLNRFKHYCISNTIDTDNFKILNKEELRIKYNIDKKKFVVLFVSESIDNYRKGFDILLEALKKIKDIDLTVLAIGNGEVNIKQKNIEIIKLGKITDQNKIIEIYNLANVFLLPSREDNLPNVILEAYSCGLPILGFNIGGVKEHILNNFTGINVGRINSKELSKAVVKMYNQISNYNSENINNYAIENFSFPNQSGKYVELYKSFFK